MARSPARYYFKERPKALPHCIRQRSEGSGRNLERERLARQWLRDARHLAHDRFQVRGLSPSGPRPPGAIGSRETARAEVVALGLEPTLVLEPRATSDADWHVSMEIPDLSSLLFRFPNVRNVLADSRCKVAGAAGRPLARGSVLHGSQRVLLTRWPSPEEILLQFEKSDPQLEYLLRAECLLRPGPRWLFRVASDGVAYQMRGLSVRAAQQYVLVGKDGTFTPHSLLRPAKISCEGVQAALLELPMSLNSEFEVGLQQLGIALAKTIQVWPAGLAAVVWDGEGNGEWLASERACIGIRADHPLDSLIVQLGSSSQDLLELKQLPQAEPVFVELPELPIGLHTVHISSRDKFEATTHLGVLDVRIRVREARQWEPGLSPQGLLLVEIDPMSPTLEQLWEGRVDIELHGPSARQAKFEVILIDSAGPILTRQLPPLALPITPDQWRDHFDKFFRRAKDIESAYDLARACKLKITADELGVFNLQCEVDAIGDPPARPNSENPHDGRRFTAASTASAAAFAVSIGSSWNTIAPTCRSVIAANARSRSLARPASGLLLCVSENLPRPQRAKIAVL